MHVHVFYTLCILLLTIQCGHLDNDVQIFMYIYCATSHHYNLMHASTHALVLKAGHPCHPVSYSFIVCLLDEGFLGFFLLLSFYLLVCYTCMHILYFHVYCRTDGDRKKKYHVELGHRKMFRRMKAVCCCFHRGGSNRPSSLAMQDAAKAFHTVFSDLDFVASDVVAGLILLKRDQRRKKESCPCDVCTKVRFIVHVRTCTCTCIILASFPGLPREREGLVHTVRACVAIFKIAHACVRR